MFENFIVPNKVNMIIDGSFGSTGKGAIAAAIAIENDIHLACSTTSPNAGHTFYLDYEKHVTHLIPVSAIIHDRCGIFFSSESVIDVDLLFEEMERFNIDDSRIMIHPRAAVITNKNKQDEAQVGGIEKIASTQRGVGSARADKILRTGLVAEKESRLSDMVGIYPLREHLQTLDGFSVIVETGQGRGLDINHGYAYPYCTSRSVNPSTILGELDLHPKYMGNIMLTFRTFPIRVGNPTRDGKEVGYSGPFFPDTKEIEFEDLGISPEFTTCTKRKRRIGTFSMLQYEEACRAIEPTHIFLNFVNYFKKHPDQMPKFKKEFMPTHVGFGPYPNFITEYSNDVIEGLIDGHFM